MLLSEIAKELFVSNSELFEFFEEIVEKIKLEPSKDYNILELEDTIWRYDYIGEQDDLELNKEFGEMFTMIARSSYVCGEMSNLYCQLFEVLSCQDEDDKTDKISLFLRHLYYVSANYKLVPINE